MARTRNASASFDVMLDRQGNPVSPAAAYLQQAPRLSGGTVLHGPGAEPVAPQAAIVGYRAEPKSWSRNMEAFELAMLLDLVLRHQGGFVVDVTPEQYLRLPGDVRRHFMAVREVPVSAEDVEIDNLRRQLLERGIEVDGRWGLRRLRDELAAMR